MKRTRERGRRWLLDKREPTKTPKNSQGELKELAGTGVHFLEERKVEEESLECTWFFFFFEFFSRFAA